MATVEKALIQRLLNEGVRKDGRKIDEMRKIELEYGEQYGHVTVTLGNTKLVVQISASVKTPMDNRPFEGLFHITTEISSMASPKFENGRISQEELIVSRLIEKAVRRSNALDLESLCIIAGQSCWMIRADVHFLNYDGGIIDAACLGVMAGLLHFKRPDTSIDGDKVIVHDLADRPPVSLAVMHVPVSVSWSLIEDKLLVLDTTAEEQELSLSDMTITVNKDREICQITKSGGFSVEVDDMLEKCETAHKIADRATKLIYSKLKEDEKVRNKGNHGFDLAENDR